MHATLPRLIESNFPAINRTKLQTLQVNLGYLCNQSCLHCHVNAGPKRREIMSRETIDSLLEFLAHSQIKKLDLTGGAPELNPHFRYLVTEACRMQVEIIDRCNLSVLSEPGQQDLADFLAQHRVEIVASLPCYLEDNVNSQRGAGVYQKSITALRLLNKMGYGRADSGLIINLMYNPTGPYLPPSQLQLEQDYKRELWQHAGVEFNHLYTLTNVPIQRFGSTLISRGEFDDYMKLLKDAFQPVNLDTVMCRSLISVDWKGYVYDCDFNQMLDMPLSVPGKSRVHIRDVQMNDLDGQSIIVADHCYACTAGQGSSCGGALA